MGDTFRRNPGHSTNGSSKSLPLPHAFRLALLQGQHVDLHDVAVLREDAPQLLLDGRRRLEPRDVHGVVARRPPPHLRLLDLEPPAARDLGAENMGKA